jgi:S-adenosylmethionine synthetase
MKGSTLMPDIKLFTSESVSEGHPDKLADQISDAILDELLRQDPKSRVAIETLLTRGLAVVAGEVTTTGYVEVSDVVREAINEVGYTKTDYGFDGNTTGVLVSLQKQSVDIAVGVDSGAKGDKPQGAGDQGMMFGFAVDETPELMPLPISIAHKLTARYTQVRKTGSLGLRPDAKSQVTIAYDAATDKPLHVDTIVFSAQHDPDLKQRDVQALVMAHVIKPVLEEYSRFVTQDITYHVNPTGIFVIGGPQADTGVTGRKIIVDTYGGYARHGGGAFSGKDPSKVDRSAAYAARFIAKNIVAAGLATKCEIQLAYAIGVAEPVSVLVETFGTNTIDPKEISKRVRAVYDLTPRGIIDLLKLTRPIYRQTAKNGHFGNPAFAWESTDLASRLA